MSVSLAPLSEAQYAAWLERVIQEYAEDKIRSGAWLPAEALGRSQAEFQTLLPAGIATPDNHLYSIRNEAGEHVGVLWLAAVTENGQRFAFVYEVQVFEPYQRRGYAYAGMKLLEAEALALGLGKIALYVFGYNQAALALYQKLGYAITDYSMAKPLR